MQNITNIKDNWILDFEYSGAVENAKDIQIMLDSIKNLVDKNLELREDLKDTDVFNFDENQDINYVPKINLNPHPDYKNYISKSQNWIGHVLSVNGDSFFAKLEDKNNPTTYETATFEIDEVSNGDLKLLKVGALFYWSVGYANQSGQVLKQSLLRFKRAVNITDDEFEEIAGKVDELYNDLNWD